MSGFDATRALLFFHDADRTESRAVFQFRRRLFVDHLGWRLCVSSGEERDEFDGPGAIYCALAAGDELVGTFRAVRCDRPYLSSAVFPQLAATREYPQRADCYEISRFGVDPARRCFAPLLYAVMLQFGWERRARALVAVADLNHERLLGKLGIRTRRFGPPGFVGLDRFGVPLDAVAGEIVLGEQPAPLADRVSALLHNVEIVDETLVLRPERLSA